MQIPLEKQAWFYNDLERRDAEVYLSTQTAGSFLVRYSRSGVRG
jgi:hypothetical protein